MSPFSTVVGVVVPLLGGLVVVLALVALALWYRSYRMRAEPPPPELAENGPPPSPERDDRWDPRQRYEG